MTTESDPQEQRWLRLAADLRATQLREQALGDIDENAIARFLAGECSPDERTRVEQGAEQCSSVRECLELARSILGEETVTQPAGVVTVVLHWLAGHLLRLGQHLGARFGEPQWLEPVLVPGVDMARGASTLSKEGLSTLVLPMHTAQADIDLRVYPLGAGQFQATLTMTDPASRRPLDGCRVRRFLRSKQVDEAETGDNGSVRFPNLPLGQHEFLCELPGGREQQITIVLQEGFISESSPGG